MDKIYVLKKDKIIKGPYTLKELIAKGVKENDAIWYEGLKDWTPILELSHLHAAIDAPEETIPEKKFFLSRIFSAIKRKK
ncbi:MAG: GYF domain-containing protein [Chitinophagaceae bacterium]